MNFSCSLNLVEFFYNLRFPALIRACRGRRGARWGLAPDPRPLLANSIFSGNDRWHTADVANPPQGNFPPRKPRFWDIQFDDAGDMLAWDGSGWVRYEDLPAWPSGVDTDPHGLIREP
jgi:hypothetical protein